MCMSCFFYYLFQFFSPNKPGSVIMHTCICKTPFSRRTNTSLIEYVVQSNVRLELVIRSPQKHIICSVVRFFEYDCLFPFIPIRIQYQSWTYIAVSIVIMIMQLQDRHTQGLPLGSGTSANLPPLLIAHERAEGGLTITIPKVWWRFRRHIET